MKVFNHRLGFLFHSSLVLGGTIQGCLLPGDACACAEGGEGWRLVPGAACTWPLLDALPVPVFLPWLCLKHGCQTAESEERLSATARLGKAEVEQSAGARAGRPVAGTARAAPASPSQELPRAPCFEGSPAAECFASSPPGTCPENAAWEGAALPVTVPVPLRRQWAGAFAWPGTQPQSSWPRGRPQPVTPCGRRRLRVGLAAAVQGKSLMRTGTPVLRAHPAQPGARGPSWHWPQPT